MRFVSVAIVAAGTLLGFAHEVWAQVQRGIPCDKQISRAICVRCVLIRRYRTNADSYCNANWVGPKGGKPERARSR